MACCWGGVSTTTMEFTAAASPPPDLPIADYGVRSPIADCELRSPNMVGLPSLVLVYVFISNPLLPCLAEQVLDCHAIFVGCSRRRTP